MYKTQQGQYKLLNEHKYIGNPNTIVYRSSWERQFLKFLDLNDNVSKFSSEEIIIRYISPVDEKPHRYFPDFYIEFKNGRKLIVEIKPHYQSIEPKPPQNMKNKKKLAAYMNQLETYLVNQAKWKAAETFCKVNGFQFCVFTEHELKTLGFKMV